MDMVESDSELAGVGSDGDRDWESHALSIDSDDECDARSSEVHPAGVHLATPGLSRSMTVVVAMGRSIS
jgi:hypothetical protein